VGLQLSFGAVAGILAVSDPVQRWLLEKCRLDKVPERWWGKCLRAAPCFVISTLSATLGASVFTIPLVGWHFGTLSLIAPLANVMTLWAVGILFVGGLLVGVAGLFTPVGAAALAGLFAPLARYLDRVVDLLSKPALAALSLDSFYVWAWIVLFYLLLLLAVKARGRLPLWLSLAVGGGTLVLAVALNAASFYTGSASAVVLDVGQGQSVLLRMGGQLTLVDCGGDSRDDPGDVAAGYLQSLGRNQIDLLVVSHYHSDHANGIPQLLNRVRVGEIALPDVEEDSPLRAEIIAAAGERGVPPRDRAAPPGPELARFHLRPAGDRGGLPPGHRRPPPAASRISALPALRPGGGTALQREGRHPVQPLQLRLPDAAV